LDVVTTLPTHSQKHRRLLGVIIAILGLLFLATGASYTVYTWVAKRNLDNLVYLPSDSQNDAADSSRASLALQVPLNTKRDANEATKVLDVKSPSTNVPTVQAPIAHPNSSKDILIPGIQLPYSYSTNAWDEESKLPGDDPLNEGFLPIDTTAIGVIGTMPPATQIHIPAIDLTESIGELELLDLGDAQAYETPKQIVGHIPESANPGELGNVWLFGHLESPIRREGSVFHNLPKIPDLLRKGTPIYVILETRKGEYLYEAVQTNVVQASELTLYPTSEPTLTLVTCIPRYVYDQRLIVSATLVGFKPLSV
jgi:LPXTG-site transpeptidase (sortase) family protein